MNSSAPKIRPDIHLFPTMHEGQRAFIVNDTIGLIKEPILLKGMALDVFGLINGTNSIQDIQVTLMRLMNGVFVSSDDVRMALQSFDEAFLLDTDHYHRERRSLIEKYGRLKKRKAFLAGKAYPDSESGLRDYLELFFEEDESVSSAEFTTDVKALIAPHIELNVAKRIYGRAYSAVAGLSPKRILLLGTGHSLQKAFFSITEKDYETPLGTVRTDTEGVRMLRQNAAAAVASHDLDHKSEHSLEFQLIFLQHIFGSDFTLLPILFGSFHDILDSVSQPSEVPEIKSFLETLAEYISRKEEETLVVAGVDLSHIGPKFGHNDPAGALLSAAREHDQRLLEAVCQGDVQVLWKEIQNSGDEFNICGFSTLSCLLELFPKAQGQILDYEIWEEDSTQSAVSFAAVVIGDSHSG